MFLIGAFLTVVTNQDPIWLAGRVLPGLSLYDALSDTVKAVINIVPFLIGWQYLADAKTHRDLLKALFVAGLAYSLLMLFEVRMSPQPAHLGLRLFPAWLPAANPLGRVPPGGVPQSWAARRVLRHDARDRGGRAQARCAGSALAR